MENLKQCTVCNIYKDTSEYWSRGIRRRNGKKRLYSYCNICARAKQKRFRVENPEKYKKWTKNREASRTQESIDAKNKKLKESRDNLEDSYIKYLLMTSSNLNKDDITEDMIESYRLGVELKRALGLTSNKR